MLLALKNYRFILKILNNLIKYILTYSDQAGNFELSISPAC